MSPTTRNIGATTTCPAVTVPFLATASSKQARPCRATSSGAQRHSVVTCWALPMLTSSAHSSQLVSSDGKHTFRHSQAQVAYPVHLHSRDRTSRDIRVRHRAHDFSLHRGEIPIPKDWNPTVVPGVRTTATPLLSPDLIIDRLQSRVHETAVSHFGAFYSSELGGIVTDPAFMLVHLDDHMVHRGHAVFDTVLITDGYLYQLDEHLQRFKASAASAGLTLPRSESTLRRILLDTAAASRKLNGIVKFWLSSGRGGFGLSPKECIEPAFFALASSESVVKTRLLDRTKGFTACISRVQPTTPPFSGIKSNNYLRNVLAQMDAEIRGYDVGIFVDEQGNVQEGPNCNLAIITVEDDMLTAPADSEMDGCLNGVTLRRIIELVPAEVKRSRNDLIIRNMHRRPLTVDDLLAAKEVFLTGSTMRVMPVVQLDDQNIADGTPGITALALDAMLVLDMQVTKESQESFRHIQIPYGYVTGMADQFE